MVTTWARSPTFAILTARITSLVIAPVVTLAVGITLTPVEQGLYYTMYSVLAALALFESGVGTVITQLAARESTGAGHALGLQDVRAFAHRWYAGVGLIGTPVIAAAGIALFSREPQQLWLLPWLLLCGFSALDLQVQPRLFLREGTGNLTSVYRFRTARAIVQGTIVVATMVAGGGLLALPLAVGSGVLLSLCYLTLTRPRELGLDAGNDGAGHERLRWRSDILPFQWRVAVSWIAGYFGLTVITPIVMAARGAIEAGRIGLTISILTMCTGLAASNMQAVAPTLARHAVRRDVSALDRDFSRSARISVLAAASLMALAWSGAVALTVLDLDLASRILSPAAFALLAGGVLAYHVEGVLAFFMRAQLREPYFALELSALALLFPGTTLGAIFVGPAGVALSFMTVHTLVILPIAVRIFRRNRAHLRREWPDYSSTAPVVMSPTDTPQ